MKRITLFVLVLLAITIIIGCGKRVPTLLQLTTPEDRLTEFKDYIRAAAISMGTPQPIVRTTKANIKASGYPLESEIGKRYGYVVDINENFLLARPLFILKHIATHEVCHIKLDVNGELNTELTTERCVFLEVGEDAFMKVYTFLYAEEAWPIPTVEDMKRYLRVE